MSALYCDCWQTKDWWTYQFCYGEEITQYHMENGKIAGDIISLGKYESDKTWLPEDLVCILSICIWFSLPTPANFAYYFFLFVIDKILNFC